jgi:hypothetical protein
VGEPGEDRHGDDPGVALHLGGEVIQATDRPARGALAPERREERRLAKGRRRPDAAGDDVEESLGGLHAALGHVHVRVSLVAVEQVGAADHRRREVRVEIERHRDRDARADSAPHRGDEVALAVVQSLWHHRPVEVEEHARPGAAPAEIGEHPLLHVVVDVAGDATGRRGGRRHGGHEGEPAAGGSRDHAAETRAGASEVLDDLPAVAKVPGLELRPVGRHVGEGVRLVRHHREERLHRNSSYVLVLGGGRPDAVGEGRRPRADWTAFGLWPTRAATGRRTRCAGRPIEWGRRGPPPIKASCGDRASPGGRSP